MQVDVFGIKKRDWDAFSLSVHENLSDLQLFFGFALFFYPVFGRLKKVEKDRKTMTCGFGNAAF